VHPTPATPSPSTTPAKLASGLGRHIGECVVEALQKFNAGRLTNSTKMVGGEAVAQLFKLRQLLIADFPDFDRIARERGVEALAGVRRSPCSRQYARGRRTRA